MVRPQRRYAIIEAPSVLGLAPTGVEMLPDALLRLGLAERLDAEISARLAVPEYDPSIDPQTGTMNGPAIARWSPQLADAVATSLAAGDFPIALGGDCSVLLGTALALRRRGRFGLLFIDGHADFYQPEADDSGQVASMELAIATGRGPALLSDIEGRAPLLREEDIVVFGLRDADEQAEFGSQPLPTAITVFDADEVRHVGIHTAARQAVQHLARAELDGFLIHVDADCLDDAVMPAVDFRLPGGLSAAELAVVLRAAMASPGAVALEVTIYNPALDDDDKSAGRVLVDALVAGLG